MLLKGRRIWGFLDYYVARARGGAALITAELASDPIIVPREALLGKLEQTKIKSITSARIVGFTQDGAILEKDGIQETINGMDTIILAMGVGPARGPADAIQHKVPEIHVIGDAENPSNAMDAIAAGTGIGRRI